MSDRRKFMSRFAGLLGLAFGASNTNAKTQLSTEDVIRAWEDTKFRSSLTEEQWNALPQNPAGQLRTGEFQGDLQLASGNNCSGNSCSGNNCSGNNCSGNNCSGNNCSGNSCSCNNCSGNNCSGNNCSGNNCSMGFRC